MGEGNRSMKAISLTLQTITYDCRVRFTNSPPEMLLPRAEHMGLPFAVMDVTTELARKS